MTAAALLNPKRGPDESQDDYRARRIGTALAVKRHLAGRLIFTSSRIVELSFDEKIDEQIRQGYFRDVQIVTKRNGEVVRIARTKGETYRKPKAPA